VTSLSFVDTTAQQLGCLQAYHIISVSPLLLYKTRRS